jgi:hypothetical protein
MRASNTNSAPIAVAFVTESTGELHCLLPLLRLAKDAHPSLRIVVLFRKSDTHARFKEDPVYAAVLTDLGAEVGRTSSLVRHLFANRHAIRLILKDFGPTPDGSLPVLLKRACPNASLVLFPHAYSLYGSDQRGPALESQLTHKRYDQDGIDWLLLNSPLDTKAWSKRLATEKIQVVGATGYTEWWGAILRTYAREHLKALDEAARGKRLVLFTTRGPHEQYLTEENYQYLIPSALKVILSFPDTLVVLKPHPREDVEHLKSLLSGFPADRVLLVGFNTLALASISTVTVSFWSSSLLDSLAAGTPGIEYYRYHRPNPQTVLDAQGQIASIYTDLGLAVRTDSETTLREALGTALAAPSALLAREREALARCYPDNEAQLELPRALFKTLLTTPKIGKDKAIQQLVALAQVTQLLLRDLLKERGERAR